MPLPSGNGLYFHRQYVPEGAFLFPLRLTASGFQAVQHLAQQLAEQLAGILGFV